MSPIIPSSDVIERAARAIAEDNGEDFDRIHRDRAHWKETRGDIAGVWRDVNASTQTDYREMARAALTAALGDTHVMVPKIALSFARQMANLCFNYKQTSLFDDKIRRNMDEAQTGFDKAMSAATGSQE